MSDTTLAVAKPERYSAAARRYQKVNALWPVSRSALPPLTDQEAISAAKRLYRAGVGHAYKGKFKIGTGNRRTWIRGGVFLVNPSRGWHDLVHSLSHLTHHICHPDHTGHHVTHAEYEAKMIRMVVEHGWLEGSLRRPDKIKPDRTEQRHQRVLARIAVWEKKRHRAETALAKLHKSKTYYDRKQGA